MSNALETIGLEQLEIEQHFAGAVSINGDHARKEVAWLSPETIRTLVIREFWEKVLAGAEPVQLGFDMGIATDLMKWQGLIRSSLDIGKYANALVKKHFLHSTIVGATDLVRAAQKGDGVEIHNILGVMSGLYSGGSGSMRAPEEIGESLNRRIDKGNVSIRWGIESLDYATRGSERGTLTVVAARPSMGKSSLVFQANEYQALELGLKVGVWALEMSGEQMFARRTCYLIDKMWMDVRAGMISATDKQSLKGHVTAYAKKLSGHLWVDDRTSTTTQDILRTQLRERFDVVMVDHIGLLKDDYRQIGEVKRLGKITEALHELAKNTNCVVIAIAQLNRKVEERSDKIPTMADLRDSGEIEQNADNVMLLHGAWYYDPDVGNNHTQIRFGKFRDGVKGGRAWVDFDKSKQVFTSLTEEEIDAISDEEMDDPKNPENKKNFVQEDLPF